MSVLGFPKETTQFLSTLAQNNNREWFTLHKQDYKEQVEAPAKAFREELEERLSELVQHPLGSKLFRIYRDVRFSKDKTPYNTHVRMLFHNIEVESSCGDKPVFCFSLEPDRIITGAGTGTLEFSKSKVNTFRATIADDTHGPALQKVLAKYKEADGYRIDPPALKRTPAGYDPDHPREALLRHKALMVWHEQALPTQTQPAKFMTHIMKHYTKMKPVYDCIEAL
jgi:uncharacterized protein (TIGR02453 family)